MTTWGPAAPSCGGFFGPETKRGELSKIEEATAQPDFWNDQERAQKVLRRRARLEAAITRAAQFQRDVDDAAGLFEFASEDESSLGELQDRKSTRLKSSHQLISHAVF